jgi:hypothetical protein
MSDPDRLTSHDDTASALDKQGLILRIIVVAFSPRSSGIRSSLPRCRDTLIDEPRARCEFESDRSVADRYTAIRSDSPEHHAQIVCGHFGDNRSGESGGVRRRGNQFEVSQTPVRIAIAKTRIECLVARSGGDPFA